MERPFSILADRKRLGGGRRSALFGRLVIPRQSSSQPSRSFDATQLNPHSTQYKLGTTEGNAITQRLRKHELIKTQRERLRTLTRTQQTQLTQLTQRNLTQLNATQLDSTQRHTHTLPLQKPDAGPSSPGLGSAGRPIGHRRGVRGEWQNKLKAVFCLRGMQRGFEGAFFRRQKFSMFHSLLRDRTQDAVRNTPQLSPVGIGLVLHWTLHYY